MTPPRSLADRRFYLFNAFLSAAALAFLGYILLLRKGSAGAAEHLHFLPAVNASLNGLAAVLLSAGYLFIRRGARRLHQYCMVSAFATSCLFFICYSLYHSAHGETVFQGGGAIRPLYYAVLASHVLLSMAVVPLALTTLYFATKKSFLRHRKIARITLPIWLYVSVTGVLIFWMLRANNS